ncbi:MAG TPA: LacI family DNA-binding transcriptional regulator, partial [Propionibacteriaceae bacterium]
MRIVMVIDQWFCSMIYRDEISSSKPAMQELGAQNYNSGVSPRMAARKASVSMKDVAALAGVSLGTVSNVLNSP